jgi:hypothetical protein
MKGFAWFADLAAAPNQAPCPGAAPWHCGPPHGRQAQHLLGLRPLRLDKGPMRYSNLDVVLKRLLSGYSSRPILHVPVSLPCVGFLILCRMSAHAATWSRMSKT